MESMKPIAYSPVFGGSAWLMYKIDYAEDRVLVGSTLEKSKAKWVKIRLNTYGPYIRKCDQIIYLAEFVKV